MSILTVPVNQRDHIRGSPDAPVMMVEYGDFECPFCGQAFYVVKELERELGNLLAVVFRHFPLTAVHPHAALAAEAAEAAGAQRRFWEMHDIMYANQQNLAPNALVAYAAAIGLDTERFTQALSEHRYAPKVREDFMSGVRSGVNGTPTFFINGVRHEGSWDIHSLHDAIMQAAAMASGQYVPQPGMDRGAAFRRY